MSAEHELTDRVVTIMAETCLQVVPDDCPIASVRDKNGLADMKLSVQDQTTNLNIERGLVKCTDPVPLHRACRRCRLKTGVLVEMRKARRVN